jgi:hypothetical protein
MLWPPPARGDRVRLSCACHASIVWSLPFVFVYRLHLIEKHAECRHAHHSPTKRIFAALEALKSRDHEASEGR